MIIPCAGECTLISARKPSEAVCKDAQTCQSPSRAACSPLAPTPCPLAAPTPLPHPPLVQRLPRSTWRDVRYRGDPLTRPIASFEVGFLVRLLVALSLRLNAWLALDRPWTPEEDPPENKAQVGSCSGVFFLSCIALCS